MSGMLGSSSLPGGSVEDSDEKMVENDVFLWSTSQLEQLLF